MNKYNSRICYKHHSQGTFILIKFKEFIQKYWKSILISWICFGYGWLIMGINNTLLDKNSKTRRKSLQKYFMKFRNKLLKKTERKVQWIK